jgi:hypothetical protein
MNAVAKLLTKQKFRITVIPGSINVGCSKEYVIIIVM